MNSRGRISDWAEVAIAWLATVAIGTAISFFPVAHLLVGLAE